MIGIINTGTSNIKSITNAVTYLNYEYQIINKNEDFKNLTCLILPGVGNFDKVMKEVIKQNLIQILKSQVLIKKVPILGICIGMQILFTNSEEGVLDGLNIIEGQVKKLSYISNSSHKVPNTGYKEVIFSSKNKLISNGIKKEALYFNHSYGLLSKDFSLKHDVSKHNIPFVASFNYENIFGMQYHPEKSQQFGLFLLKRFFELSLDK